MASSVVSTVREIIALTESFAALKGQVQRLAQKVEQNTEGLIRLETRQDMVLSEAKHAASQASAAAAQKLTETLYEKVIRLEFLVDSLRASHPGGGASSGNPVNLLDRPDRTDS